VAGSLAIAALAFATEGIFALLQYLVTPRGLRKRGKEPLLEPTVGTAAA
jgi:ABC-type proline/glycine betaine transport system permease subunit